MVQALALTDPTVLITLVAVLSGTVFVGFMVWLAIGPYLPGQLAHSIDSSSPVSEPTVSPQEGD